jgi:DNA-binding SARP family transcriptional activator
MGSSAERDYAAEWSGKEDDSLRSRDVLAGAYPQGMSAPEAQRRTTMEELPGNVSVAPRQRDDRLPFDSEAWKLGHDLVDQHEYVRAAECFRRMLLLTEAPADRLSIEAAEVAAQLCAALSRGRSIEKKLQDARRVLSQDLSQLSYEEVSIARDALAACMEAQSPAAHHASSTSAVSETTGATVGRASLVEAPVRIADLPRLRVHFFGRFELLCGEEAFSPGRNVRALAILKYLFAHRGDRPVPQDYLMDWLWPDSDPKRARWSLNSAVYALRKLLGSCLSSLPASETVLFEEGCYRLSPCVLLSADTDEFDSHYEEGLSLEEAGRIPEAVVEYEKAADLYRGEYLIEDLYEEWTMIERERLSEVYTDLLGRLAIHYMEGGRLRESVRTCYRILEKDRCDEDTHRLLMECFVRLGQRARALRQYKLCEGALRHEYDLAPSPETRALYASILKDCSYP